MSNKGSGSLGRRATKALGESGQASNKGSGESGQVSNKGSGSLGRRATKALGESGQASNKGSGESKPSLLDNAISKNLMCWLIHSSCFRHNSLIRPCKLTQQAKDKGSSLFGHQREKPVQHLQTTKGHWPACAHAQSDQCLC